MISSPFRSIKVLALATWAMIGLAACISVGPDYSAPKDGAPAQWHAKLPDGLTTGTMDSASLANWWATFDDPALTGLVQRAIANNLDLKSALSSVRQARAQRAVTQSGLFPTVSGSGSATRTHTRTKTKVSGGGGSSSGMTASSGDSSSGDGGSGISLGGQSDSQSEGTIVTETDKDTYRAGFDASWEVDVFGGLRRSLEASTRDLEAQQAAFYDALVSLTAEVATNYVSARAYQTRIDLAESNLAMQKETLDLVEARFQAELTDELPVQQARSIFENTAAQIPTLRTGLDEALNRLAVLAGESPGAVHDSLAEHRPIPTMPAQVAVGVPSEALRRRPDIRKAEMELAAQTARIGVAVADLYPKFYLTGSLSRQGDGTLGFRKYPTDAWSLGPSVSWTLLDAGALRQNVKVQTEKQEQYLLAYRSAVLNALEEAENKIYSIGQQQLRKDRLAAAVVAAKSALELSKAQYSVGQVDFSDVIIAEQSVVTYEDNLAQCDSNITTDLISLFKAMGGGWTPQAASGAADTKERTQQDEQR